MVLLHIKGTEKDDEFIYECQCTDSVDKISKEVINIHNFRMKIRRFSACIQELAKYGPMRKEEERLLSKQCIEETMPEAKVADADMDPNGLRVGKPCSDKVQETMNKSAKDALEYIDVKRTQQRHITKLDELQNHFDCLKGCVMIGFPMGLPKYDIIYDIVNDSENLASMPDGKRVRDPKKGQLWFASKKLSRNELLSKYIGSNEKTKIVIKISKQKGHMPVREPAVTEETQKHMMAFWHRKQEEEKQLKEDNDTSYLTSEWANPDSLKQAMVGVKDLKFR